MYSVGHWYSTSIASPERRCLLVAIRCSSYPRLFCRLGKFRKPRILDITRKDGGRLSFLNIRGEGAVLAPKPQPQTSAAQHICMKLLLRLESHCPIGTILAGEHVLQQFSALSHVNSPSSATWRQAYGGTGQSTMVSMRMHESRMHFARNANTSAS